MRTLPPTFGFKFSLKRTARGALGAAALLAAALAQAEASDIHFVDQGPGWTTEARRAFYAQDEGAQLVPLAWLKALRTADGAPFLAAMTRYGFLPNPDPRNLDGLPIGFTRAMQPLQGAMTGLTCSACHVRQIKVAGEAYRIDGGPAVMDFAGFVADLDAAVGRVLANDAAFQNFAGAVLGANVADETHFLKLHADVQYWWVRFHTLVSRSLPDKRPWGPTRLDAIAVIYNFIAGLDVGAPPTFLIPENVQVGDAPVRYPFLWNVLHQDHTQWTGVAEFGNDDLTLARNLSEIYGVFANFRPVEPRGAIAPLNRDYLLHNSTNFAGFDKINALLAKLGAPVWPFGLDPALAAKGKAIFERPGAQGGCAECHGQRKGEPRPPVTDTWATPVVDVGTDRRAWQVLLRTMGTGSLEGATIPDAVPPLKATDLGLNLLKVSVAGAIVDKKAESAMQQALAAIALTTFSSSKKEPPKPPPEPNRYEAKVLHGVWAAAPYLHNGSVPTLEDLLKPAGDRPKDFAIGPNYDPAKVGLAASQDMFGFTLKTTGCEDRNSGDSNCGHEFGTSLPDGDKKALLEFLKTL